MNRILFALSVLSVCSSGAAASDTYFISGNELGGYCQNQAGLEAQTAYQSDDFNKCLGFVEAVSDDMTLHGRLGDMHYVTTGQLIKVVRKYTDDHPEQLNRPAVQIVEEALAKAFPK